MIYGTLEAGFFELLKFVMPGAAVGVLATFILIWTGRFGRKKKDDTEMD